MDSVRSRPLQGHVQGRGQPLNFVKRLAYALQEFLGQLEISNDAACGLLCHRRRARPHRARARVRSYAAADINFITTSGFIPTVPVA